MKQSNPTEAHVSRPTFITIPVQQQSDADKRAEARVQKPFRVNIHDA